jgi:hypothetical protein
VAIDKDSCRAKSAGDPLDYDIAIGGLLSLKARDP